MAGYCIIIHVINWCTCIINIYVITGYIKVDIYVITGYIKVDIPWTSLFSSSVVVRVEDVYLLAGPVTDRVYDPERERALQNAIKRETLESLGTSTFNKVGK
jgi:hypothetical protein